MDTLTHALSGALLARATSPAQRSPHDLTLRARMAVGFLAAAFPDSDFVLRLIDTLTYLTWHQGITHSVVLLPMWALMLAHLLSWLTRRRYPWQAFFGTAVLGIAVHIAGDVFTAYGTLLLAPLSDQRFSWPFTFVIDPYFSVIVAGGLAAAMFWPERRRLAAIALTLLAGYVSFQGVLHSRAVKVGEVYAATHGLTGATVHALPQPLTPFNWKIIVSHNDVHHQALVNLWRTRRPIPPGPEAGILQKIATGYQPVAAATWKHYGRFGTTPSQAALTREAWGQEVFADFRRFAMFPALDHVESTGNRICVWFFDLRFTVASLPPSFRYGLCRANPTDSWRLERTRGSFWLD